MLAMVNPPPKGRFKNGINPQIKAIDTAIASIIADVVSRFVFVFIKFP